jgi:ethanolamine utilization protein EutN
VQVNLAQTSDAQRAWTEMGKNMFVGKVVGSIVATRKNDRLIGSKFLIVEPLEKMERNNSRLVAVDIVGAGIGEIVLVATGSAARIGCNMENSPIDAAIVGIVDDGIGLE